MDEQLLEHLSTHERNLFKKYSASHHYPLKTKFIHHTFEQQVQVRSEQVAVEHGSETITYKELNAKANQVARFLHQQGVRPGHHVGLFLTRSIDMIVGILGILKAGAAYVPQDPRISSPKQLKHVIHQANIKIILTQEKHLQDLEGISHSTLIDLKQLNEKKLPPLPPLQDLSTQNTCYVIFTSGTTGLPNGVQVSHENLINLILSSEGSLGMQAGFKVGQILNVAFDMAAWEIFLSLSHGGTLCIREQSIESTASKIDLLIATPSILATIDKNKCRNLKIIAVAGESCPLSLAQEWSKQCIFYNSCGPTEVSIVNTVQRITPHSNEISIGKPIPNTFVYILDQNLKAAKIGEPGEMWIGGLCVSKGYVNNQSLSDERYLPDPFFNKGGKMFRSRDLAKWNSRGELIHLGRTDDQVKIKGFRVELESISNVLGNHPEVQQACTLKLGDNELISMIAPVSENIKSITTWLKSKLPYYSIPEKILSFKSLPITPRGKIDKRALLNQLIQEKISQNESVEFHENVGSTP